MLESIARLLDGSDDGESAPDADAGPEPDPSPDEWADPPPEREPPGPDTTELENRLEDLENDLESTSTSLDAVRNAQEEMNDSVQEVNDTVRQLVGVYDQLAASRNPFVDDGRGDGGSGVVDGVDPADEPDAPVEGGERDAGHDGDDPVGGEGGDHGAVDGDEPVSFDDLAGGESAGDESASEGDDHADHTGSGSSSEPHHRPVLESIPDGYAGELLLMEWISRLMEQSGPAGALRAVEYYHDLGLISGTVRDHVVELLGGPALDVFVDPMQPHEPTVEEHAVSTNYLRALRRLED